MAAVLAAYPAWFFLAKSGQIRKAAGVEEDVEMSHLVADNLGDAVRWLWAYWTWPVALAGLGGVALGVVKRRGPELLLAAASLAPVAVFVSLSFYWYPRYILFATVPFLVLAARCLVLLAERAARLAGRPPVWLAALLAAALVPAIRFDAALLADPAQAPLPRLERFQYVDGFSSGYGCPEAVAWLRGELAAHRAGSRWPRRRPAGGRSSSACGPTSWTSRGRSCGGWIPSEPVGRRMLLERAAVHPTFLITGSKEEAGNRFEPLGGVRLAQWRKPNGTLAGELYRVDGRPEAGAGPDGPR